MKNILEEIKKMDVLSIPKAIHSLENVQFVFGPIAGQTESAWLVHCSHSFREPASEREIDQTEKALGLPIPQAYKELLSITNGANLFCVPRKWLEHSFPGAMHIRFPIFGCEKLVQMNKSILDTFLQAYVDDPEYQACEKLNYVAFCNADDGNFQALLLNDYEDKHVFLLFHEFSYRPYSLRDAEFCYRIADSLRNWLDLIRISGGWEGRGDLTSGL